MQNEQVQELKRQIENFKKNRTNTRESYPHGIRDAVKIFYRQGFKISQISNVLGLPYDSIQNWVAPKSAAKFKEVKIKTTTPKAVVEKSQVFHIAISKNGFDVKIENSSPDMLLRILKGL